MEMITVFIIMLLRWEKLPNTGGKPFMDSVGVNLQDCMLQDFGSRLRQMRKMRRLRQMDRA